MITESLCANPFNQAEHQPCPPIQKPDFSSVSLAEHHSRPRGLQININTQELGNIRFDVSPELALAGGLFYRGTRLSMAVIAESGHLIGQLFQSVVSPEQIHSTTATIQRFQKLNSLDPLMRFNLATYLLGQSRIQGEEAIQSLRTFLRL